MRFKRLERIFFVPNFADVSLQNEKKQFNNTIMKKRKTTKNLMAGWVVDLANRLMDEESMTRSEAFRQAHLVRRLLEALGQGKVCFEYEKQDGERREAFGTLRRGIDPVFDAYEYKDEAKTNQDSDSLNFTYWDVEKKGFRTFSAARIVKIIAISVPNYSENNEHESHELIEFV